MGGRMSELGGWWVGGGGGRGRVGVCSVFGDRPNKWSIAKKIKIKRCTHKLQLINMNLRKNMVIKGI